MRRLHPSTLIVGFVPRVWDAIRALLPALAASLATGKRDFTEIVLAGMGVLGGFGIISTYLTTRFGVEGNELVWRSGWLFKRDRRISLDHIHNVNMRQGLLERLFNVVTLEVETAAGHGAELKLQALSQADAEQLRAELLSSAAAAEDPGEAAPVYRVTREDLWLGAITENQGAQVIFVLLTIFGGAALVRGLLAASSLTSLVPATAVWVVGGLLLVAVLIAGWLYGAVAYAIRFGGFMVRSEPGIYRVMHGLLSKMQFVLRTERIEYVAISSTLWQKWIGRATLRVGTAGSFGEHGVVAPLALMVPEQQANQMAESLLTGGSLEELKWNRFPPYLITITIVRAILNIAFFGGLAYALSLMPGPARLVWPVMLLGPVLTLAATTENLLSYRLSGYAVGSEIVAVRQGFLMRKTELMPLNRVHLLSTSQPLWWSWRGVTSLTLTGMVHSLQIPMLPAPAADDLKARLSLRAPAFKPADASLTSSAAV